MTQRKIKPIGKKRIVFHPNPKTVGDLKFALSGYEDALELINPLKVFIIDKKGQPFKMMLKHATKKEL
jgi:hypothetical protein